MTLACKFYCKKAYPNTILVKSFAYIDQGGILYWCSIHHNFWYRKAIHMQQCCGCGIQKNETCHLIYQLLQSNFPWSDHPMCWYHQYVVHLPSQPHQEQDSGILPSFQSEYPNGFSYHHQ